MPQFPSRCLGRDAHGPPHFPEPKPAPAPTDRHCTRGPGPASCAGAEAPPASPVSGMRATVVDESSAEQIRVWAATTVGSDWDDFRESVVTLTWIRIIRAPVPPDLHLTVQAPGGSSLSKRLAVHDTGRDLDSGRNFGRHVRSLRRARGMTQEVLAERSGLSADTIRRLEHGSFSPSLDTLRKLCVGLDLMLSTLFESFELGARNETRELIDLIATRSARELILATKVLRALFEELDKVNEEDDSDD